MVFSGIHDNFYISFKIKRKKVVLAQPCNPRIWKSETRGLLRIPGHPRLHIEYLLARTRQQNLVLRRQKAKNESAGGSGSALRNPCCSCRRPWLTYQHLPGGSLPPACNSSSREFGTLFWHPRYHVMHIHIYADNTHTDKIKQVAKDQAWFGEGFWGRNVWG